ncbi:MAG: TrkA family potassium uptake protein [Chloroflexi bacterium]|nr:TrkA family potassium uptake protein [Chloroflexota bacterium]
MIVIGLGRFGSAVATTLYRRGHEVLGVDSNRDNVEHLSAQITHAVQADAGDEDTMRELGVEGYDVGIVAIGSNVEASVIATLILKRFGVPHVIAKAGTHLHGEILRRIGANRVVFPESDMGVQVAHTFTAPHIEDYLEVAADYGISLLRVPEGFTQRSLAELDVRNRYGLVVLLLRRGEQVILHPQRDELLRLGDLFVVAGPTAALEKLSSAIAAMDNQSAPTTQ